MLFFGFAPGGLYFFLGISFNYLCGLVGGVFDIFLLCIHIFVSGRFGGGFLSSSSFVGSGLNAASGKQEWQKRCKHLHDFGPIDKSPA